MIYIPTRNQIYANEASEILSEISMYPGILEQQLYHLHPTKEAQIQNLLAYLLKQGRIQKDKANGFYMTGYILKIEKEVVVRSVWVLIDFLSSVEYHSASDYPIVIVFFIRGEEYQIIYAAEGNEAIVSSILHQQKQNTAKRIVLVDTPDQIPMLTFSGIIGYCTSDTDGHIQYYQLQGKENKQ